MNVLEAAFWPESDLGEALAAAARRSGLATSRGDESAAVTRPPLGILGCRNCETPSHPGSRSRAEADIRLHRWLDRVARRFGIEVEALDMPYTEVEETLQQGAPMILRVPGPEGPGVLVLVGATGRRVRLLTPEFTISTTATKHLARMLCNQVDGAVRSSVEDLLDRAGIDGRRRLQSVDALVAERLSAVPLGGAFQLRVPPDASFFRQMLASDLPRRMALGALFHLMQIVLLIVAWWLVGRFALQGTFDTGWLLAWILVLLTIVPLRMGVAWMQGRVAMGIGALFRRRLLAGILKLRPDTVREEGAGGLLGRVMDSEAVETLALSGASLAVLSVIELSLAVVVLWIGAGGAAHALLLALWLVLTASFAYRYHASRRIWTDIRLSLTHDLVERMLGHRTLLAQQPPERWHDGEDELLWDYLYAGSNLDRREAWLLSAIPTGWLLAGIAALAPAILAGTASSAVIAVGLGGVLLAWQALTVLTGGLASISAAAIAWRRAAPLFHLPDSTIDTGSPGLVDQIQTTSDYGDSDITSWTTRTAVEMREARYRYPSRADEVLQGINLKIFPGDRILLEGPSGGGKSTIAALLLGLREPDSGLVLAKGLDRATLGADGWRGIVAGAPQFHENHVLSETFAFNLLMARRWPPAPGDLEDAETVARDVGLGPLLDQMPGGILQMVGESGWQLSHGERSRLFLARALLQRADVIVLDETFAALDPENLATALEATRRHASSLIVIAHP